MLVVLSFFVDMKSRVFVEHGFLMKILVIIFLDI